MENEMESYTHEKMVRFEEEAHAKVLESIGVLDPIRNQEKEIFSLQVAFSGVKKDAAGRILRKYPRHIMVGIRPRDKVPDNMIFEIEGFPISYSMSADILTERVTIGIWDGLLIPTYEPE